MDGGQLVSHDENIEFLIGNLYWKMMDRRVGIPPLRRLTDGLTDQVAPAAWVAMGGDGGGGGPSGWRQAGRRRRRRRGRRPARRRGAPPEPEPVRLHGGGGGTTVLRGHQVATVIQTPSSDWLSLAMSSDPMDQFRRSQTTGAILLCILYAPVRNLSGTLMGQIRGVGCHVYHVCVYAYET